MLIIWSFSFTSHSAPLTLILVFFRTLIITDNNSRHSRLLLPSNSSSLSSDLSSSFLLTHNSLFCVIFTAVWLNESRPLSPSSALLPASWFMMLVVICCRHSLNNINMRHRHRHHLHSVFFSSHQTKRFPLSSSLILTPPPPNSRLSASSSSASSCPRSKVNIMTIIASSPFCQEVLQKTSPTILLVDVVILSFFRHPHDEDDGTSIYIIMSIINTSWSPTMQARETVQKSLLSNLWKIPQSLVTHTKKQNRRNL